MSEMAAVADGATEPKDSSNHAQLATPPSLIDWKSIWKPLSIIGGIFLVFFSLPLDSSRFSGAVIESLALARCTLVSGKICGQCRGRFRDSISWKGLRLCQRSYCYN